MPPNGVEVTTLAATWSLFSELSAWWYLQLSFLLEEILPSLPGLGKTVACPLHVLQSPQIPPDLLL